MGRRERRAVMRVMRSGMIAQGPEVAAFEEEVGAHFVQGRACVAVNSGTAGQHLGQLAAGVGPGDEVITVPFTFVATVAAIGYSGARPIFVDIDPESFTMDVNRIEAAITGRTKAIIPVHLYGQPADMDPILAIARRHNLVVIEDAAQAHGAEYKGRRVGGIGDMGCFSFYPGKNLGAYGEGGSVVTSNPEYLRTIRMLRDWGAERKYYHELKGYNYRMEGIQGAVLRVKLQYLEPWGALRRAHAEKYSQFLQDADVVTPKVMPYARPVWHVYGIRCREREVTQGALLAKGIQTNIHYPFPVHLLPAYADLGYKEGDFVEAEAAAREELSLPMFPELTVQQIEQVSAAVQESCLALQH
ncbi:MAG: DegT/DnrJ/EryC1/StrS family aminotransferase [Acidobacteria bacterium]|nr:DegT/DnrJ/EryC1/StrS family aminotransferase [Acidobacteriota bacterium]